MRLCFSNSLVKPGDVPTTAMAEAGSGRVWIRGCVAPYASTSIALGSCRRTGFNLRPLRTILLQGTGLICAVAVMAGIAWSQPPVPDREAALAPPADPSAPAGQSGPTDQRAKVTRQPVSSEQIAEWIRDLDSDEFIKRELATQQLQSAGAAAIRPLRESLQQNRPELATRGIHILRQLIFEGNEQEQEAAVVALESLAAQGNSPMARRASAALENADEFLAQRAVEELVQRGARVEFSAFQVGFQFQQRPAALELGDAWHGEDDDLRRLVRLKDVSMVTLSGDQVTDHWLKYISSMPGLSRLRISRGKVTEAGLQHLRESKRLTELILTRVAVGDGAVEVLSGLAGATEIQLFATDVTKEGETKLQAALPNTHVVRREVFLGITSPRGPNWSITAVEPDTPASRAGLEVGDVITRFNEHEIVDFDNLSIHIAASKRRQEVMLEIRRGNEVLTKKVRFD